MKFVRFAFAAVAFALLAACTADVTGPSLSKPGSASTSQGAIGVPH